MRMDAFRSLGTSLAHMDMAKLSGKIFAIVYFPPQLGGKHLLVLMQKREALWELNNQNPLDRISPQ